jgi:hypothetical protein
MPRQPIADVARTLDHVMGSGIIGGRVFANTKDRENLLGRVAILVSNDSLRYCVDFDEEPPSPFREYRQATIVY